MTKAHRLITRKPSITRTAGSSPQSLGARQREAMAKQHKGLSLAVPINFLVGCSDSDLGSYQLARQADVANLRAQKQVLEDQMVDHQALAYLAAWLRSMDRPALKAAIENEESAYEWAKRMVREGQRSKEEKELFPLPPLPPDAAHRAAALRYQERNIAEGKCQTCPKPLAHNSVRYCEEHLAKIRARASQKKGLSDPGSREYLYSGELPESTHGRQPGTLAAAAMNREKKTRALLAEMGIPPESAAITRRAVKEALMERMPQSKEEAKSTAELFLGLPTSDSLAKKALAELFSEGKIQRIGKGIPRDPFRYFAKRKGSWRATPPDMQVG